MNRRTRSILFSLVLLTVSGGDVYSRPKKHVDRIEWEYLLQERHDSLIKLRGMLHTSSEKDCQAVMEHIAAVTNSIHKLSDKHPEWSLYEQFAERRTDFFQEP